MPSERAGHDSRPEDREPRRRPGEGPGAFVLARATEILELSMTLVTKFCRDLGNRLFGGESERTALVASHGAESERPEVRLVAVVGPREAECLVL